MRAALRVLRVLRVLRKRRPARTIVAAIVALGPVGLGLSFGGCNGDHAAHTPDAAEVVEAGVGDALAVVEAEAPDAGPGEPTKLGAMAQTSVIDGVWWPESNKGTKRLGYLRHGATVEAFDRPIVNSDCKEGWYALVVGGYVCGKAVTAELTSPRVRLAPKQPDHDAGMPYRYGVNLSDDTPLYRRVLPPDERKKYEPWLAPAKPVVEPKPAAEEPAAVPAETEKTEKAETEKTEVAVAAAADDESAPPRRTEPKESTTSSKELKDAGVDAGRPKLKELKGRGVLVRKMARGFYLALDREFKTTGQRWWRTSFGFAVPFERIMLQPGRTKHVGTWFPRAGAEASVGAEADAGTEASLDAGAGDVATAGTVAFVSVGFARRIEVSDDQKKASWGAELPKRTAVMLTGRDATVSGQRYHETTSGFWVRLMDLKMARPAPPADLLPDEKWIDIDLTRQALVAFEGTRPVFATLISSGRRNLQDKEKDFPTPTGTFRIGEKHVTTTMDGDVASDGPYSIEDVPWVMYFQGSYGLHAAFWHDQFGRVRSHGCVNMAPEDARTIFAWSDPPLPAGWHGVFSKDDQSGTRIVVHEDKDKDKRSKP